MEKISFEQLPEMMALLLEKVERLETLLTGEKKDGPQIKEMLTIDEAADYMGISKSWLYKMTMSGELPTYRPGGKRIYLKRSDINQWMSSKRRSSASEIEQAANDYIRKHPLKR
ncbi:helix-turn-helix domain-containing protein [Mucilaginibacter litoreus]|uniref:Helix-turn-helix domain-containing protein n=1 Tax=Mucilaginibacter litoreus TaxID=1048221 RepID=A0ABW3AMP3_9SPHI